MARIPPSVDTGTANVARVYDYLLGGKDNFEVDREMAKKFLVGRHNAKETARAGRLWLRRVVGWLSRNAGILQFLDLGSGLPTVENTHEIAQRVDQNAVVVYVDNDPAVIAHGRALLDDDYHTFFAAGDLTEPAELFSNPEVEPHLDLDSPLAVLQCATLHFIPDQAEAEAIVAGYVERIPSGSYVAIAHACLPDSGHELAQAWLESIDAYREAVTPTFTPRSREQLAALFGDLELVEPGIVPMPEWWPEGPRLGEVGFADFAVGGLGRKR